MFFVVTFFETMEKTETELHQTSSTIIFLCFSVVSFFETTEYTEVELH